MAIEGVDLDALAAEGAVGLGPAFEVEVHQGLESGDAQGLGGHAAPVEEGADADDLAAVAADAGDDALDGAAGGHHVLDGQDAGSRDELREAALQGEASTAFLGPDGADVAAEVEGHAFGDGDRADGRSDHGRDAFVSEAAGERGAEAVEGVRPRRQLLLPEIEGAVVAAVQDVVPAR